MSPARVTGMEIICPNCGERNMSWCFVCWKCEHDFFEAEQKTEEVQDAA